MSDVARIDKWLWAARIFKTRSIAADACKNGRVSIGGVNVKPSHTVKAGETVCVRKPPVTYSFRILKTIEQRVGAKLVPEVYENVTTADQYELLEMNRISGFVNRARGTGRPTKRIVVRWMPSSAPRWKATSVRFSTMTTTGMKKIAEKRREGEKE